jgi:hypothetical protein
MPCSLPKASKISRGTFRRPTFKGSRQRADASAYPQHFFQPIVAQPNRPGTFLLHFSTRHRLAQPHADYSDGITAFRYPPLTVSEHNGPIIRLLTLMSGAGDDPIRCQISAVPLSNNIKFEAISYCWGDPTDQSSISCNSSSLTVPRNLATALRSLRLPNEPRTLWADAICINQTCTAEKDAQVQLMRDIFSNAHRTLIWLGSAQDRQEERISRFAVISLKIGLFGVRWLTRGYIMPSVKARSVRDGENNQRTLQPFSAEFYLSLVRFLRRPWFRSAWVVQEVVVSKRSTFLWDSCEYDWEEVVQALKAMATVKFPLAFLVSLQDIAAIEHERQRYVSHDMDTLGLLLRQQRCLSTDARDKVFSVCGLIDESSRSKIRVSYLEDTGSVYRQLAQQILRDTKSLDILSRPPLQQSSSWLDLPSWVPDWSLCSSTGRTHNSSIGPRSLASTEARSGIRFVSKFRAAGDSYYENQVFKNSAELLIEGYAFDTIKEVGPVFEGTGLPSAISTFSTITDGWRQTMSMFLRCRMVIISWQQMANLHSSAMVHETESIDELFWQTICAGELFESGQVASAARFWKRVTRFSGFISTYVPKWLDNIGISYCTSVLLWQLLFRQPLLEFELQGRYTLNRRMIATEKGRIGLASCTAAVGDRLSLCKGSTVPLILRPSEGTGRWKLVGDAYVHGVMKGEIFEKSDCEKLIID